ncbi:hypothetical protein [Halopseudomonas pelagia]|uniref:hypothetical protein n=1 Tax=Halopseudomonas pelagia TaxID=553151 RepID=UPI0003A87946|nr:hypothetical protein [Halopseudomonas pelagia]
MRIYMLPLTITATLMSANAVQAERIYHYKAHSSAQAQSHNTLERTGTAKTRADGPATAL